jgi:hypothetical protein
VISSRLELCLVIFDNQPALRLGVLIGSAISGMLCPAMGRARHAFNFDVRKFSGRRPVVGQASR